MNKLISRNLNKLYYFLFFITVLITQFSSIDKEVIDWDESTFFIISKFLANGSLLYADFWDAKPPLIFMYLAMAFKMFGSSLLVGRLAGDLLIFITVLFTFKILDIYFSKKISIISTFFLIYLFSYDASQPTMTEHLGIVFIIWSLYLLLIKGDSINFVALGVLFSLAFNTRNNLAFVAAGVVLFLLSQEKLKLYQFYKLIVGFALPIASLFIYFLTKNTVDLYSYMLIKFPIEVSKYRITNSEIKTEIYNKLNLDQIISFEILVLSSLAITVFYFFKNKNRIQTNQVFSLNLVILISIIFSIIAGGRLFNHYFIQTYPFIAILFASTLNLLFKKKYLLNIFLIYFLALNIGIGIKGVDNIVNYENIYSNYPIKNISEYVKELNITNNSFLVLENHILYFYIDDIRPFKVVHPSNLPNTERYSESLNSLKKFDLTIDNEFYLFVEKKPDYIFCEIDCYLYIEPSFYTNNYNVLLRLNNLQLYQKISND